MNQYANVPPMHNVPESMVYDMRSLETRRAKHSVRPGRKLAPCNPSRAENTEEDEPQEADFSSPGCALGAARSSTGKGMSCCTV